MSNQHKLFRLFFTIKINLAHYIVKKIEKKKENKLNRTDKPFILISSIKAQCLLFLADTNIKNVQPTSIILITPLQLLSTLLVAKPEIERICTLSSYLSCFVVLTSLIGQNTSATALICFVSALQFLCSNIYHLCGGMKMHLL